ncbi:MAG: phosphatidylserine/phosphatidylglycerophosphate/cardiolipin synthase family protein [Candidatus Sericytochromatia bacterium]|nr:phosphatidylserine/phosphatidylglycerophosphate/cardiolipin synthase family protein [Candidatus Tanganyikabacteria bacterium]
MRRGFLAFMVAALTACGQPLTAGLSGQTAGKAAIRAQELERAAQIDRAIEPHVARKTTRDNDARLYMDGAAGFAALRELIGIARKSIWIETFIWHNDATGIAIAQLLRKRALEGLDVRILVDAAGTAEKNDRDVQRILRDYQVPVRYFNPFVLKGANLHVSHRKLYLADGVRALTGGMNIGVEYEHDWHDLLVGVTGSAARQMHAEFAQGWNDSQDGPPEELVIPGDPADPPGGAVAVRVAVTNLPPGKPRCEEIKNAHWAAIRAAKKRIRTFHIYLADPDYIAELRKAVERGVKVELLIPSANDFEAFKFINRHWAGKLLDAGATIKVYESRFSHIKYLSVDGAWVSLGSANADSRSFYENEELNLLFSDPAFTQEADRRVFEQDWAEARWPVYADLNVPLRWKPVTTLAELFAYYI